MPERRALLGIPVDPFLLRVNIEEGQHIRPGQQRRDCSMAAGLPYAIGAQTAYPGRQVVVFTGDGSMTMQLGDFLTCVQHDLPVKVVVIKNNTLGLIKWEQMVFLGNPEYGVNMAPLDFVKFAEACGARGMRRIRSRS
jgi:pyruvate dehydrogenase (quinone)